LACIRSIGSISRFRSCSGATILSTFGLDLREEYGALRIHTTAFTPLGLGDGRSEEEAAIISFGAFEDDLPRFRERLDQLRIARIEAPPGAESNGIWFRDPDATPIENPRREKSSPNEKSSFEMPGGAAGVAAAPSRSKAPVVRPRRLAHVQVFTRDIPKTIRFYGEVLDFAVDRSGDMIAFMHAIHGSDHHVIAFVKSEGPGLPSLELGCRLGQRHRPRRHADAEQRVLRRLGARAPRARLELFPLRADPWGSYAEYSRMSTTSRSTTTGRAEIHPPRTLSMCGVRRRRRDFAFNTR